MGIGFGSTLLYAVTGNHPPVVLFVTAFEDRPPGLAHVLLEFALAIQVVIALIRRLGTPLSAHDPGNECVLLRSLVPAPATAALLKGPGVDEDTASAAGPDAAQQGSNGVLAALARRQVMDNGYAYGKVGGGGAVGQGEAVGDDDLAGALGAGEAHEGMAAVGA